MEVYESEKTVMVVSSDKNYEFRITDNEAEPVSQDIPSEVLDILEKKGYDVNRPDKPRVFDKLRFQGPYEGAEAGSVLEYDIDDPRYEKLQGLMDYGLNVSIKVHPDGKTEIYEVRGTRLDNPVEV